jgi:transcription termination/antitermination protein NusG
MDGLKENIVSETLTPDETPDSDDTSAVEEPATDDIAAEDAITPSEAEAEEVSEVDAPEPVEEVEGQAAGEFDLGADAAAAVAARGTETQDQDPFATAAAALGISEREESDEELPSLDAIGGGDVVDPQAAAQALAAARPRPVVEAPAPAVADSTDEEEETEADQEEEEELVVIEPPDDGIKRRWYALHAYSGQEANVKKNLTVHAELEGLDDLMCNVLVPMEQVAEIKSGEKKISKRKFFPGYVLIQLPEHPERNPELWHMIKETPGVSGFIGTRAVPVPLEDDEVKAIVEEMRGERERPRPKVNFEAGERIKIIDGPFANFLGNIDEINLERGRLRVMVEIFERLTSVEVEFWQVEKV